MSSRQQPHVALTTFDDRTARAVVVVLRRAGVDASSVAGPDGETDVTVPEPDRDRAMQVLGSRMEEVAQAVAAGDVEEQRRARPAPPPRDAEDDVHAGPPLVMERFRRMRYLAVILMVPLLVVTLAPTIRGNVRVVVALVLMGVAAAVVLRRRR